MPVVLLLSLLCAATSIIITPETSSEVVTIPLPSEPDLSAARSECPHDASGLLSWEDAAAWAGGTVPTASGQDATVAAGVSVLLSAEPTLAGSAAAPLGKLTIPSSSALILGENLTHGVSLDAHGVVVQGALRAGSGTCRLDGAVTITLHGARPGTQVDSWHKGVVVEGAGVLGLHGKQFFHTWTRLARSVAAGDMAILLQGSVNWEPGQQARSAPTLRQDRAQRAAQARRQTSCPRARMWGHASCPCTVSH